jgi:hypothetical protein
MIAQSRRRCSALVGCSRDIGVGGFTATVSAVTFGEGSFGEDLAESFEGGGVGGESGDWVICRKALEWADT